MANSETTRNRTIVDGNSIGGGSTTPNPPTANDIDWQAFERQMRDDIAEHENADSHTTGNILDDLDGARDGGRGNNVPDDFDGTRQGRGNDPSDGGERGSTNQGRGNREDGNDTISPSDIGGNIVGDIDNYDDILTNLNDSIFAGYQSLLDPNGNMQTQGDSIISLLKRWQDYLKRNTGLNETNSMSIAQSVYNTIFALVEQNLTANVNLRNWYLQQNYNSPAESIKRLMDAGINPAYFYGAMSQTQAGSIGDVQSAQGATATLGDNTTNKQRKFGTAMNVLSGVSGAVGSLVQGGFGGATQGVKNLADSTASLGNLELQTNLQPFQIGSLMSQSATNWATASLQQMETQYKPDLYKAQQYEMKERAKNYTSSIETKQREIDAMIDIAKWNNDTNLKISDNSCWSNIITANIGAAAQRYSADKSYSANVFSARLGLASSVLPHVYTKQRQETLYDASTGEKINLSAQQQADLRLGILTGKLDFQEGKEMTWNGRKVVGAYFDTDVLDVVRLGGMNEYFNNFIETSSVFGNGKDGKPLYRPKMANDMSDYMEMVNHIEPYLRKASAHKITEKLMIDAQNNASVPLYNGQQSFTPAQY